MPESRLRNLSIEFAVKILNLVKDLKNQRETIVSNQIGRSGTSIGANILGPIRTWKVGFHRQIANRIEGSQ